VLIARGYPIMFLSRNASRFNKISINRNEAFDHGRDEFAAFSELKGAYYLLPPEILSLSKKDLQDLARILAGAQRVPVPL
jgi:hypothetical protein